VRRIHRSLLVSLAILGCGSESAGDTHDRDPTPAAGRGDAAAEPGTTSSDAGPADAAPQLDAALLLDAALVEDAAPPLDATPRLSELVESVFVPTCVLGRCHTTLAPEGELSFTGRRISVHAALVNAASSERPDRMRVVPYDPDASYLMEKLESDTPSVGTRMPPLGALPQSYIERVRAWIAAGARDD
jgi:hypothetical protein